MVTSRQSVLPCSTRKACRRAAAKSTARMAGHTRSDSVTRSRGRVLARARGARPAHTVHEASLYGAGWLPSPSHYRKECLAVSSRPAKSDASPGFNVADTRIRGAEGPSWIAAVTVKEARDPGAGIWQPRPTMSQGLT